MLVKWTHIPLLLIVLSYGEIGGADSITEMTYKELSENYVVVYWKWYKNVISGYTEFRVNITSDKCPGLYISKGYAFARGRLPPLSAKFKWEPFMHLSYNIVVEAALDDLEKPFTIPIARKSVHVEKCKKDVKIIDESPSSTVPGRIDVTIEWQNFVCQNYQIHMMFGNDSPAHDNLIHGNKDRFRYKLPLSEETRNYQVTVCGVGKEENDCIDSPLILREANEASIEVTDISAKVVWAPFYQSGVGSQHVHIFFNKVDLDHMDCHKNQACQREFKGLEPLSSYHTHLYLEKTKRFTPVYHFNTTGDVGIKRVFFFEHDGKSFLSFSTAYQKSFEAYLMYKVVCYHAVTCDDDKADRCSERVERNILLAAPTIAMASETKPQNTLYNCTAQLHNPNTGLSGRVHMLYKNRGKPVVFE